MILSLAMVGLYLVGLAAAGFDANVGQGVFAVEQAGLAAVILLVPATRRTFLNGVIHFWPAVLAFCAVIAIAAWQAGLFEAPATAFDTFAAKIHVGNLGGLILSAASAMALANAHGRRPLENLLLRGALVFVAIDIIEKLQKGAERPFLSSEAETATVYALLAVFTLFVLFDEASHQDPARRRAMVRRLILPIAVLMSSVLGLALTYSGISLAALGAGVMGLFIGLAARQRKTATGLVLGAIALVFAAGGVISGLALGTQGDPFGIGAFIQSWNTGLKGPTGLGAQIEGGVLQIWPVQIGPLGAGALVLCFLLVLGLLGRSGDRRLRPSRGFALALGAIFTVAFAGAGGATAAVSATLALLLGIAGSYSDRLRQQAQLPRRPDAPPQLADQPATI